MYTDLNGELCPLGTQIRLSNILKLVLTFSMNRLRKENGGKLIVKNIFSYITHAKEVGEI